MAFDLRGLTPLLQVYDMPASLHFYRDLLGFEIVSTSPKLGEDRFHWVWLRLDQADLMLNTAYEFDDERPAERDRTRTSAHKDTGLYLACPNVDAAYAELCARGVKVMEPKVTHYGMKQMYFQDPDGYELCFQWSAEN
jgi:catechol 2,3-dioxygenase-like lactoylglutathione lyase family enzyme